MTFHPVTVVGWILVVVSLLAYVFAILSAVLRIHRQYGRSLAGARGMRPAAAFAAAARLFYLPIIAAIGLGVVWYSH
jgi:hypothetical protein